MRVLASAAFAASLVTLFTLSSAFADSRVFIIANESDGYGIDQCLARGERCGASMAKAYCQQRDFTEASTFRRVEPGEITGTVPTASGGKCSSFGCMEYVAITCQR